MTTKRLLIKIITVLKKLELKNVYSVPHLLHEKHLTNKGNLITRDRINPPHEGNTYFAVSVLLTSWKHNEITKLKNLQIIANT